MRATKRRSPAGRRGSGTTTTRTAQRRPFQHNQTAAAAQVRARRTAFWSGGPPARPVAYIPLRSVAAFLHMSAANAIIELWRHKFHVEFDWHRRRVVGLDAERAAMVQDGGAS